MVDSPEKAALLVIDDLSLADPAWRALTSSATGTTPVHDPTISHVASLTSGCHLSALGAWREGQLVGGVAVVVDECGDVWPRSLAPYNGPLIVPMPASHAATRHRHESTVAGALLDELAARHRSVTLRLRPRSIDVRRLVQTGWTLTSTFTFEIPTADLESTWRNIDDNRRRLIRRAERQGCIVREVSEFSPSVVNEVNRLHLMMRDGYRSSTDLDADSWSEALQTLFETNLGRLFTVSDADEVLVAFDVVTTVPYAPNTCLVFFKTRHSWHSVAPEAALVPGGRLGMQVQLYEPDKGALTDLSAPDLVRNLQFVSETPTVSRRMKAGRVLRRIGLVPTKKPRVG